MESFLLIGGGELGRRVGVLLRTQFPHAPIHVQTRTIEKHPALRNLGLTPELWSPSPTVEPPLSKPFSHVVIAVPPKQSPLDLVTRSLSFWNRRGAFIYVSSTGVYSETNGGWIDECSPRLAGSNANLEAFEDMTLDGGGWVVRFAGLYSESRGPHRVYRSTPELASNPKSWINLFHDDDAAAFCTKALLSLSAPRPVSEQGILLGSDGTPITREHLATVAATIPPIRPVCKFTDPDGALGKRCTPKKSWERLGFSPKFPSFDHFALSAKDTH